MSKFTLAARILLGLAFVVFGLNGFVHFFAPPAPAGEMATVFAGLMAARYLFPLMFAVMTLSGVLFLAGRFVPLALTCMAPILVNILGFHLAVDLGGIGPGAFLTALELFLAWRYREAFAGVLAARHTPAST